MKKMKRKYCIRCFIEHIEKLSVSINEEKFPQEWCEEYDIEIIDADGWKDKSISQKITKKEFVERCFQSTCKGDLKNLTN